MIIPCHKNDCGFSGVSGVPLLPPRYLSRVLLPPTTASVPL